jgi:HprK-related kinase B
MVIFDADQPDLRQAVEAFKANGNPMLYVQKMLELPGRDLGVMFLGGKYVDTYARVKSTGSWNSTIHAGGRYEKYEPSREIIELAERAQSLFNLDFTSVDVVETEQGPLVFEVSAFGGFAGLRDGCGFDAASAYAEHAVSELLRKAELEERVGLRFDDFEQCVWTNSPKLAGRLRDYFRANVCECGDDALQVKAVQTDPFELDLLFFDWPREGGKIGRKEAYCDIPGGRVISKVRTGMQFLVGPDVHVGFGDCETNDNQIINFVIAHYISYLLGKDALLCHAAGVAHQGKGLMIAAASGAGKSTLSLHLMATGLTYVSNDRVLVEPGLERPMMHGVPKQPRVNPGTLLHNPGLTQILDERRIEELRQMDPDALWQLEEKYDVDVERVYGRERWRLSNSLDAFLILNWSRQESTPPSFRQVDLRERRDLLDLVMKGPGPFYMHPNGSFLTGREARDVDAYLAGLSEVPVYEVHGGVNFDAAVKWCRELLESM